MRQCRELLPLLFARFVVRQLIKQLDQFLDVEQLIQLCGDDLQGLGKHLIVLFIRVELIMCVGFRTWNF